ncbi:hypothetical protein [Roseimaritima ulvae]|uniref:hypothetical protein n=1 Tax=Roseimaritima ulvae TaxID=980254 RepID=UPI0012FBE84E|nr:hypothetical protein [Roseimaritima ulvae]
MAISASFVDYFSRITRLSEIAENRTGSAHLLFGTVRRMENPVVALGTATPNMPDLR